MPVILGGRRRGTKLLVPDGKGVRPTLARVREALFSMITSQIGTFTDCRVLAPFAGSGALGLEAYSRGAAHIDFVEANRTHYALLLKNIEKLDAHAACHTVLGYTPGAWHRLGNEPYDLVLCDPPYAADLLPQTLEALLSQNRLAPGAILSLELDPNTVVDIPKPLECLKTRQYAQCLIMLLRFPG